MRKGRREWMLALFLFTAACSARADAPDSDPRLLVEAKYAEIVVVAEAAVDRDALTAAVTERFDPMVSWDLFAARTLGSERWATLDAKQQKRFINGYKDLIIWRYARAFKPGQKFTVELRGDTFFSDDRKSAEVQTTVLTTRRGKPFGVDVDYQFKVVEDASGVRRWAVGDLIIDTVSRALTFRRSFVKILDQRGFDDLVQAIERNVKRLQEQAREDDTEDG